MLAVRGRNGPIDSRLLRQAIGAVDSATQFDDFSPFRALCTYDLDAIPVNVKGRYPVEPYPTREAAVEEEIGIAPSGKDFALVKVFEADGQCVSTCGERLGEHEIEPEVLAIDSGDRTAVDPDIPVAIKALAAKPPRTRTFG
jgi:hypothetical protein